MKYDSLPPQLKYRGFRFKDGLILAALGLLLLWVGWRVLIDFKYDWQWDDLPGFIIGRDESGRLRLGPLGHGLALTLKLSLWASALAMILGLILALGRLSRFLYFRLLSRTVVEVSRNIPPLVLIFIGFYFLSAQFLPWPKLAGLVRESGPATQWLVEALTVRLSELSVFFPVVLTLALYEAAYFAEIFRGAIIAVPLGQWEASWCLGLNRFDRYRFVILLQVFRKTSPQLAGPSTSPVKASSIFSVVSLAELTYSSMKLSATYHHLFEIWLTAAGLYFIFNFALSSAFQRLEQ